MTTIPLRTCLAAMTMILALASPRRAQAEDVAVTQGADLRWGVEASASLATSGEFSGWGGALRGMRLPSKHLAVGAGIETATLHAEGVVGATPMPFRKTFQSTFLSAVVRARLPVGIVTPYLEVGIGYVVVTDGEADNSQCGYGSGFGFGGALGVDVSVLPSVSVGVRGARRNPGGVLGCGTVFGPWSFDYHSVDSLALTTAYTW